MGDRVIVRGEINGSTSVLKVLSISTVEDQHMQQCIIGADHMAIILLTTACHIDLDPEKNKIYKEVELRIY